jgi:hypothetical protein
MVDEIMVKQIVYDFVVEVGFKPPIVKFVAYFKFAVLGSAA